VTRRRLVTVLLVLAVVALFALPLVLDGGASEYAGSDSQAAEAVEESGYTPWFESVSSPSSSEVESGLFALQAALGGGALGYVLGRLRGRRQTAHQTAQQAPRQPAPAERAEDAGP
jgi:cobalt/nickel transport protein